MSKGEGKQQALRVGAGELPRTSGHRLHEGLNALLREAAVAARHSGLPGGICS